MAWFEFTIHIQADSMEQAWERLDVLPASTGVHYEGMMDDPEEE